MCIHVYSRFEVRSHPSKTNKTDVTLSLISDMHISISGILAIVSMNRCIIVMSIISVKDLIS